MILEGAEKKDQRQALGEAFPILGKEYPDLLVLSPDTSRSTGAAMFRDAVPERFLCTGVSEMNTLAMAAGLALEGWKPLVAGFAMFVGGKAWEPIRNSIAYPRLNVKIVATHGGINVGPDGVTHQMVEDIALMRALPGMTVLAPTDANQVLPVLRASLSYQGPVYVRLERHSMPMVTDPNEKYQIGEALQLRQGREVTLIGEGSMVFTALEAAAELAKLGVEAEVISAVSIKPLDAQAVIKSARRTGAVVALEDHNRHGGLGSAVAELLCQHYPCPMEQVALQDTYAESGSADQLRVKYRMAKADVVESVKRVLRRRDTVRGANCE
jgi:transketolase